MTTGQGEVTEQHGGIGQETTNGIPEAIDRERLISILSVIALPVLWETTVRMGLVPATFFPAPSTIVSTFLSLAQSGELWHHTFTTLWRLGAAFALASFFGITLGLVMGMSSTVRAVLDPIVAITYPIPKIALLPLTMIIFGLGDASIIVTATVSAFYLILLNTSAGVREIDDVLFEVADNFQATGFRKFYKVILPGSMPLIFTGLRIGLGVALIVVVAAEFIASESGLGYLIFSSWRILRVERMYVAFVVIGLIGYLTTAGLSTLGNYLMPWHDTSHRR